MTRAQLTRLSAALVIFLPLVANAQLVAHAVCRPTGDRPEDGLSGAVSPDELDAGVATQGFKCNTDLVGQFKGEGASWQLAAWKNCAYFDQRNVARPRSFKTQASSRSTSPTRPVPKGTPPTCKTSQ